MVNNWVPVVFAAALTAVGLGFAFLRANTRAQLGLDDDPEGTERVLWPSLGVLAALVAATGIGIALLPPTEPGWGISGGLAILACAWPAAVAITHPRRLWMAGLPFAIVAAALSLGWFDPLFRVSFLSAAAFLPLLLVLVAVVSPSAAAKTPGVGATLNEPKR